MKNTSIIDLYWCLGAFEELIKCEANRPFMALPPPYNRQYLSTWRDKLVFIPTGASLEAYGEEL